MDPLSHAPQFRGLGTPVQWTGGTTVFGSVLKHLIQGVDDFASVRRQNTYRAWSDAVAFGCVPWMNHPGLEAALARLSGCCVVISKSGRDMAGARRMQELCAPLPTHGIPGLRELGLRDERGEAPVIGPSGPNRDLVEAVGPVRVAGYSGAGAKGVAGGGRAPLLHAKMLVLGEIQGFDDDEYDWGVHLRFEARRAWLGSANWTMASESGLEFGVWVDEPTLVRQVADYVCAVITFSEPFGSTCSGPAPDLVHAKWDDEAMAEAAADMYEAAAEMAADAEDE